MKFSVCEKLKIRREPRGVHSLEEMYALKASENVEGKGDDERNMTTNLFDWRTISNEYDRMLHKFEGKNVTFKLAQNAEGDSVTKTVNSRNLNTDERERKIYKILWGIFNPNYSIVLHVI